MADNVNNNAHNKTYREHIGGQLLLNHVTMVWTSLSRLVLCCLVGQEKLPDTCTRTRMLFCVIIIILR